MRRFAFFTLFFLVCLSLFGQTSREVKIYVPPIAGYGRERDNNYFYKQVAYEVIFQYQAIVESQSRSDYIFKGRIEPVSGIPIKTPPVEQTDNSGGKAERSISSIRSIDGRREFYSIETKDDIYFYDPSAGGGDKPNSESSESGPQEDGKGYFFILEMIDSGTAEVLGRQRIIFYVTDELVGKLVSIIVSNLLSDIPDVPNRGDSRDRWLYFETSILWMPRMYYGGYEDINFLNFGMKLGMELRFLKFMSLGAGAQITQDQVVVPANIVTELTLEIPVSLKLVFKLGRNFALEPYGGVSLNRPMGSTIELSEYSWFAGLQFGIKDKSETGMFVIDPRFSMDFYDSVVPSEKIEYRRYCAQLGFGYKFGAIQKKK